MVLGRAMLLTLVYLSYDNRQLAIYMTRLVRCGKLTIIQLVQACVNSWGFISYFQYQRNTTLHHAKGVW
jgi:hypothetical protein